MTQRVARVVARAERGPALQQGPQRHENRSGSRILTLLSAGIVATIAFGCARDLETQQRPSLCAVTPFAAWSSS